MSITLPSFRIKVGNAPSAEEMPARSQADYSESEARALIGKTFRTRAHIFGIREGRYGKVVDIDKIRAYVSHTGHGPGGDDRLHYSVIDEWHLTIEWTGGTGRRDVFRKNEVAEYLTPVN